MIKFFHEEVIFSSSVTFNVIPKGFIGKLAGATPSVKNVQVFTTSGVVVTVTNFLDGATAQTVRILGDGATTISNNTTIKTNTGANKLLASNRVYTFTLINSVWYES